MTHSRMGPFLTPSSCTCVVVSVLAGPCQFAEFLQGIAAKRNQIATHATKDATTPAVTGYTLEELDPQECADVAPWGLEEEEYFDVEAFAEAEEQLERELRDAAENYTSCVLSGDDHALNEFLESLGHDDTTLEGEVEDPAIAEPSAEEEKRDGSEGPAPADC